MAFALNECSGPTLGLAVTKPPLRNGINDKLLEDPEIDITEPAKVQASLARLVLARPGEKLFPPKHFCCEVYADVAFPRRESGQSGTAFATTLVPVVKLPNPTMPVPHIIGSCFVALAIGLAKASQSLRLASSAIAER